MSSIPGRTLEAFILWNFDLRAVGQGDANLSLQIAEAIGTSNNRRPLLTEAQFAELVKLYAPYRDPIERLLINYDEDEHGSWRDYAWCFEGQVPKEVTDQATELIKGFK